MTSERVMVFIDGSNFYHGLTKTFGKANIEYHELGKLLAGSRELVQVFYYTAPVNENMGRYNFIQQQRFLEALKSTPKVTVKLGHFLRREKEFEVTCPNDACGQDFKWVVSTYVEKGADVFLAVDMIRFACENKYDVGILVSADGDFAKAVEVAKLLNKRIENIAFREQQSYHLKNISDSFKYLEDIIVPNVFLGSATY